MTTVHFASYVSNPTMKMLFNPTLKMLFNTAMNM